MENEKSERKLKIQNVGDNVIHIAGAILAPFCVAEFSESQLERYDNEHTANLFKPGPKQQLRVVPDDTPLVSIHTLKEKLESDARASMAVQQTTSLAAQLAAQVAARDAQVAAVPQGSDQASKLAALMAGK
jgi:hypothetical protein